MHVPPAAGNLLSMFEGLAKLRPGVAPEQAAAEGTARVRRGRRRQEVRVPGRADRFSEPDQHQHCPLEDEAVSVRRPGKAVEEALQGVPRQDQVGIQLQGVGVAHQANVNRTSEPDGHAITASR
jgi:hypothetical protein